MLVEDAVLGVSVLRQSMDKTSCFRIQKIELSAAVTCTKGLEFEAAIERFEAPKLKCHMVVGSAHG